MIKWILYSLLFIIIGLFVITIPEFIDYFETDKWYFNIAQFFKDFPTIKNWCAVCMLVAGVIGIIFVLIEYKRKSIAFIIQQSADGDFGNPSLSYPKLLIGTQSPYIYENIASLNRKEKSILELDKIRIKRFYESFKNKKKISFLGVALFPLMVYAGYVVGNAGQKVIYFHYDRNKKKGIKLFSGFKIKNDINVVSEIKNEEGNRSSVVALSVSYPIDENIVVKQFLDKNIVFCNANIINTESTFNKKTLNHMAMSIRRIIEEKSKGTNKVDLLLSCPSELCFAIGQNLCSPGLPQINVYNFNRKASKDNWDWYITLN